MTSRYGFATLLVVLAVVIATVPAGALPALSTGASTAAAQDGGANASSTSNASFGASVSGFMQASAANAEGEVDDGMFNARFNNAPAEQRQDLVRGRAGDIEQRLEGLREQRAELLNTTDGEEPSVADRAKAARLTARIDALQESINTTSVAADRAGVNLTRLAELRASASELSGPEVAELARGLAGAPQGGPGVDVGERGNDAARGGEVDAANTTDDSPSGPDDNPGNSGSNGGNGGENAGGSSDTTDDSTSDGADTSDA